MQYSLETEKQFIFGRSRKSIVASETLPKHVCSNRRLTKSSEAVPRLIGINSAAVEECLVQSANFHDHAFHWVPMQPVTWESGKVLSGKANMPRIRRIEVHGGNKEAGRRLCIEVKTDRRESLGSHKTSGPDSRRSEPGLGESRQTHSRKRCAGSGT